MPDITTKSDIYSYNFDKNLNTISQEIKNPLVYNSISDYTNPILLGTGNITLLSTQEFESRDQYGLISFKITTRNTVGAVQVRQLRILGALPIRDSFDNEWIGVSINNSAVNNILVANVATGSSPRIEASGDDANIGMLLRMVGTGGLHITTGTTNAVATAMLELTSTTKGFLPSRLTTTQRDDIVSPATGLMIYNSTTNKLNFFNGTAWEAVTSA